MEKVYRLLDWLDVPQAVDWLGTLTCTPISANDLWKLVLSKQCDCYIQALGLRGIYINDDFLEIEVIGRGFQLVVGSTTLRKSDKKAGRPEKRRICLEGPRYEPDPLDEEIALTADHGYWEAVTEDEDGYPLYFKPVDIKSLADKLNGVAGEIIETEDLRKQLELERAARELAEAELSKRMRLDGSRVLEEIRSMSSRESSLTDMQRRAEKAEHEASVLEQRLTEQTERLRRSEDMAVELARRLAANPIEQPLAKPSEIKLLGLAFPYATRELNAMRAAIAQYWEHYSSEKRQPTQKEVALEIGELLGLPRQGNGEAARKAIVLATAIRPDTILGD